MQNEYLPYPVILEDIIKETSDIKTFRVRFADSKQNDAFSFKQGQFAQVSVLGAGEAPISISSSPSRKGYLDFTIREAGKVTRAIHGLKVGDTLHLRGPYGNSFPVEDIKGKNLYFVAGGCGLPPLRSVIQQVLDNRDDFNNIKILYGAKTPDEICFKGEIEEWKKVRDVEVLVTVDNAADGWDGHVGLVTHLWDKTAIDPDSAVALVCGPSIMLHFVIKKLKESGFADDRIIMTVERYMKCGIGKCGHCNVEEKFICVDGPVFYYGQLSSLPEKEAVV